MSSHQSMTDADAVSPMAAQDEQPASQPGADWESLVVQRIAHHVNAVRQVASDASVFGWESEGLRRLSREVTRVKLG